MTPVAYFIQLFRCQNRSWRVTPFGYSGINGYVLLPLTFRSLSRPSSSHSSIGIHHKPMFRLTILLFLFPRFSFASLGLFSLAFPRSTRPGLTFSSPFPNSFHFRFARSFRFPFPRHFKDPITVLFSSKQLHSRVLLSEKPAVKILHLHSWD